MTRSMRKAQGVESPYAWGRLLASLTLTTIGGSGMYSISVVLAPVQGDFGAARADASVSQRARNASRVSPARE